MQSRRRDGTSEVGVGAASCDSVFDSCTFCPGSPWGEEQSHLQLTTMVLFGQYPENLCEVELMGNRIICLEEDISRQEGIQASVARASVLVTVRTSLKRNLLVCTRQ